MNTSVDSNEYQMNKLEQLDSYIDDKFEEYGDVINKDLSSKKHSILPLSIMQNTGVKKKKRRSLPKHQDASY